MKSKNQIPGSKSSKQKLIQIVRNVPLCLVIAAPIIIDISITCSLIKYFSFDRDRQTIENIAKQAQNQISDRVFLRPNKYLSNNRDRRSEIISNSDLSKSSLSKILQQVDLPLAAKVLIVRENTVIATNFQQQIKSNQAIIRALKQPLSKIEDIEGKPFSFTAQQQNFWGQIYPWQHQSSKDKLIVVIAQSELASYVATKPEEQKKQYLAYLLPTILLGIIAYIWIRHIFNRLQQKVSQVALGVDAESDDFFLAELNTLSHRLVRHARHEQDGGKPFLLGQHYVRQKSLFPSSSDPWTALLPPTQGLSASVSISNSLKQTTVQHQNTNSLLIDMSHELRSPLNAILGFAQIMQQESSLTRSQQENMAIIDHSGKRMLSTINDLIDLSKIEANRLVLAKDSFDFYLWLDSFECSLRHEADSQGLDIFLIKHPQLPQYICTDERRLRQILTNLVSYCLKHNQSESIIVEISSSAVDLDSIESKLQNLHFVIENLNFSLALLELVDLFDPVISVCQKGKFYDHSPLNLPISRQLAKLMKGDITVEHDNYRQGRIIFRLDLQIEVATSQEVEIKSESSPQKVISLELEQPNYRVLVVDDSKTNRKIMVQTLEKVGFEIQEAANGKEAIDIWLRWQPHMIWMDIQMPVMDGYEATEQIKSDPQSKSLPIVAFSASSLEEQRSLFQASGCDDFVEKPFSENIIFEKIAQHLGVRYIYQSITPSPSSFRLTSEALKVMPDSWLNQLEQAAAVLDDKLLTQLLQEIPPEHSDLRDALQKQIDNFDFEQIINLAQEKSY